MVALLPLKPKIALFCTELLYFHCLFVVNLKVLTILARSLLFFTYYYIPNSNHLQVFNCHFIIRLPPYISVKKSVPHLLISINLAIHFTKVYKAHPYQHHCYKICNVFKLVLCIPHC